jgi:hypothetical protein
MKHKRDFERGLVELGMTQSGAARYFDLGPRTVRSYIAGEQVVPVTLRLLVAALIASSIEPNSLREQIGLEPVAFNLPAGRPPKEKA